MTYDYELPSIAQLRKALRPEQRRFAEEYSVDSSLSRAAKASQIGMTRARLFLKDEDVAMYLEALYREIGERCGIDAGRVRHEMAQIAFSNVLDYAEVNEFGELELDLSILTREQAAAISEVTTKTLRGSIVEQKVKLYDKPGMLKTLGQHLGMFIERSEVGRPGEFKSNQPEDEALRTIEDLKGKTGVK